MRRPLFSIAAAAVLVAGAGLAHGQSSSTTTTTWSNEDGSVIRQDSTTHHYSSFVDPSLRPDVGSQLPSGVTLYPLPPSVSVPQVQTYSYGMVNNNPVVVDRTTRKVVHTWE
jgi:Protein of unknown function (DUF1236)